MSDAVQVRRLRKAIRRAVAEYERIKRENAWLRAELAKVRALSPQGVYR